MKRAAILLFFLFSCLAWAQVSEEPPKDSLRTLSLQTFTILEKNDGLFTYLPGSVSKIDLVKLQQVQPLTTAEMLKKVPGLNIADEEGVGLRLNIGIRGTDPDRSRGVHMMEDGIPIALGPYGENDSYYSPLIDRMSGIEVVKGSGQILYGPQTIGGIINFITADPPERYRLNVKLMGGTGLNFLGNIQYGQGFNKGGFVIQYTRKQGENVGPTWYRINDVVAKVVLKTSDKTRLTFKAGFYNEISNSTYVGLTQTMWEAGDQFYTRIAPYDRMVINRYSGSLQHEWKIRNNLTMHTTLFGYRTEREWRRQDFTALPDSNYSGTVWGDTTIAGGAIYMSNTSGLRYRYFDVAGVENKFTWNFRTGKISQRLDAGVRFIYERAHEKFSQGQTPTAETGIPFTDEIRNGYGFAVYAQDKLFLHKNLVMTVGVRGEFFLFDRDFNMVNGIDTIYGTQSFVAAAIPGIGINYQAGKYVNIFTGIHRGFAPPRIKDAVNTLGVAVQLDPEDSWNYELGARLKLRSWFTAECTGFFMEFLNQVVPSSLSAGGGDVGLVNGGSTRHAGVEIAVSYDIAGHARWKGYKLIVDAGFTYQYAAYSSNRMSIAAGDTVNIHGNLLPYAPSLMVNGALSFESPFGLGARINAQYTGAQFTDDINTLSPTADGRTGLIPGYLVMDASASYKIPKIRTTIRLSVKNFTDNRYIASRRPMGIKAGIPLFIMGGFEFQL